MNALLPRLSSTWVYTVGTDLRSLVDGHKRWCRREVLLQARLRPSSRSLIVTYCNSHPDSTSCPSPSVSYLWSLCTCNILFHTWTTTLVVACKTHAILQWTQLSQSNRATLRVIEKFPSISQSTNQRNVHTFNARSKINRKYHKYA